jgi:branched-chain amino acid transport system substrate-binding protein
MTRLRLKHSAVSSVVAAVLLIVGLAIGAGIGYAAVSSGKAATSTSTYTTTVAGAGSGSTVTLPGTTVTTTASGSGSGNSSGGLSGTINIGVLDDLTDGLSGEGIKINFTVHQAISDINAYLQNTPWAGKVKFNIVVEDYALDNTKAQSDLATFQSDGIVATVGPLNSGTAQAILSTADSDQIVMISPSSTSAALAIASSPTKYLFRTAPTDIIQGMADAQMIYGNGVKYLIQIYRQDTYGSGLANYTAADFKAKGGTIVDSIPYDITTSNFAPYLSTLNSDWAKAVQMAGGNNDSVAIQMIAFDEGATLLQQASTSYPGLIHTPQPWYGTDGVEGETVFTNSTVASIMQAVRLPSTVFGYTNSSKTQILCNQMMAAISQTCDPYPIGAYDDVWIAALSILACNENSGPCVRSVLTTVADNYYGVSGWTELNANGDRAASDYLIYCITGTPSNLAWTVCGSWSYSSDTVSWTNKPAT